MQEMQETQVPFLGWEDPLEEGMETRSNILAWRSPWTEEPGRLQSMGHKDSDTTEHSKTLYLKLIYKKTERENSDNNQQNMNQEQSVISSNVDRNHSQVKK